MPETLAPAPPATVDHAVLLADYASYLTEAGYSDRKIRLWGARHFLRSYPDLASWRAAPLAEQRGLRRRLKYFANFLFLTHRLRPTLAYLLLVCPKLALVGKRAPYADLSTQFHVLGRRLGYAESVLQGTLHFLFGVMAYVGKPATALTPADLASFEQELRAFAPPPGLVRARRGISNNFFRICQLLFQAGVLPDPAVRYQPFPARARDVLWDGIPLPIRQVVWRYLDQLATVRAPETVTNHEGYLRRFFAWLAREHPAVTQLRAITRPQLEEFKRWLHATPCRRGTPYQRPTIAGTLGTLRRFVQTLQEWEWPEAPTRPLVFASDRPVLDEPLPRFLDDAQAAALLHAARQSDDLFTRVCVETLLRTGLRQGEFLRLQLDSVVQVGPTYWLHVPLGKLHTDRYIPLHSDVKRLFDAWLAQRSPELRTRDLFVLYGRRLTPSRVDAAVKRAARAAGLDERVTPHRLRHTLATQAINRGMSLEAIAALLGHRSLTMTLVYARIANHTVRDQYFAVSARLDDLYATAALGARPGSPDGSAGPGERSAGNPDPRPIVEGGIEQPKERKSEGEIEKSKRRKSRTIAAGDTSIDSKPVSRA